MKECGTDIAISDLLYYLGNKRHIIAIKTNPVSDDGTCDENLFRIAHNLGAQRGFKIKTPILGEYAVYHDIFNEQPIGVNKYPDFEGHEGFSQRKMLEGSHDFFVDELSEYKRLHWLSMSSLGQTEIDEMDKLLKSVLRYTGDDDIQLHQIAKFHWFIANLVLCSALLKYCGLPKLIPNLMIDCIALSMPLKKFVKSYPYFIKTSEERGEDELDLPRECFIDSLRIPCIELFLTQSDYTDSVYTDCGRNFFANVLPINYADLNRFL